MAIVAFIIGTIVPALSGWLLLRLTEGKHPVLLRAERWILGFLIGLLLTTFLTFVATVTVSLPLTRLGFLVVQAVTIAILLVLLQLTNKEWRTQSSSTQLAPSRPFSRFTLPIVCLLGLWVFLKIITGTFLAVSTPVYYDDTSNNWNLRGKVYFVDQRLNLALPGSDGVTASTISSYPPSVPLAKTWFAVLAGEWNEGLVNTPQVLWFFSTLGLFYFALRRSLSVSWALGGVYLLSSLPLYLMHGTSPYADVFVAAHLFAAVSLLFLGITETHQEKRMTFLRLSGIASALLPFTKNEGLLIYLPLFLVLVLLSLIFLVREKHISLRSARSAFLWFIVPLAVIALPWIIFKWMNGLTFGNAKSIASDFTVSWQPGALQAIFVNTFMEGNWLLLFPLFIILVIAVYREAFRTSLLLPTIFVLAIYFMQLPLFLFTNLSHEALYQTGYARGLIHLVPLVCFVTIILLQRFVHRTMPRLA